MDSSHNGRGDGDATHVRGERNGTQPTAACTPEGLLHRRGTGRRRGPERARRAAADGRRGGRRGAGPAPRAARTRTPTSAPASWPRRGELAKESGANLIACDDELTARQERNLEQALGLPVVDRTTVILDIFASHAGTAEGKLQVELAQLEYNLARMRGLWSHLERLGGGIGTRGPGETQIETDRRLARDRIAALRRRLEHVKGTRAVQRAERERAALPTVALVGYTNAGKSTLLNALTGAEVSVRDRLFHTLDPTTRTLRLSRPSLPADRHRRLHQQASPPAGGRVRRHARGNPPRAAAAARASTPRLPGADRDDDALGREHARGDRRHRRPPPARAQQGRPARRRGPRGRAPALPQGGAGQRRDGGGAAKSSASGSRPNWPTR